MMDLVETIEKLMPMSEKHYHVIRDNRYYDLEQLLSLQRDLEGGTKTLEGFSIIIKEILSMRRAMIVILQEKYYPLKSYEEIEIKLSQIESYAKSRFIIKNRELRKLDNPQAIHPKNPCLYYEDNNDGKKHYRIALKILTIPSNIYFIDDKALENLVDIYNDIIDC